MPSVSCIVIFKSAIAILFRYMGPVRIIKFTNDDFGLEKPKNNHEMFLMRE